MYPSKTLTKTLTDESVKSIARSLASGEHDTIVNAVWKSSKMKEKLMTKVEKEIEDECAELSSKKNPSILSNAIPVNIMELTDSKIVNELMSRAPTLYRTMQAACSRRGEHKNPKRKFTL